MCPRVRQHFWRIAGGIGLIFRSGWHGHGARASRGPSLQGAWLLPCAEAVRAYQEYATAESDNGE